MFFARRQFFSTIAAMFGAVGSCFCLAACAVGPDFVRPAAPTAAHYTNGTDPVQTVAGEGISQSFTVEAKVDADWWHLFKSPQLDAVITDAFAGNPGVAAAQASLKAAEDNLRSGYGIFYPQVGADFGASRQLSSPVKSGLNLPSSTFNLYSLSGTVSYALDVFGGERRAVESLAAQADVQHATEQATYLTLASNVADAVIAAAAYRAEIDATKELIDLEKEQVALAKVQARAGTVPYSSVLSVQSQLASVEATIPGLEQKLTQSEDLLAALAGHSPADWNPPKVDLTALTLPGDLPVSLPSDLVRQRPDILAAEATAHSASADIGVATAAMLPNFTLSGTYGTNSTAMNTLFAASGNFWSVGANVAQPIFEGGTLWYKRKAAIDIYQQSMALYRQTALSAFEQVADTLKALDHDAETSAAEDDALATAKDALHLVQTNYRAGLATYLDVLSADAQYHQAAINQIQAVATRYQDTVALFAALGGGWWNAEDLKKADAFR